MRFIRTPELTLEPQMATHAAEMFVVLSDPAIYEYENAPPVSADALHLRYTRLETRQSPDGGQQWLNWVIRLPSGPLIGYVQATVNADHSALIAYELASPFWGRGLAHHTVAAMIGELAEHYQTRELRALLKRENHRSMRLLERLGFALASTEQHVEHGAETDESLMHRSLSRK